MCYIFSHKKNKTMVAIVFILLILDLKIQKVPIIIKLSGIKGYSFHLSNAFYNEPFFENLMTVRVLL